jgi:hypothetical protein
MKKWKKITMISSGVVFMMGTLFGVSFAWFQSLNSANFNNGEGYTASAYFAGGNGSAETPYIITDPIHLYNLAWLQYLGYFNLDKNSDSAIDQKYFVLSKDLDMTGWVLPPIGTTLNPFVGSFNGNGHIISSLTTDNALGDNAITRKPSAVSSLENVNIVGFWGVVGNYNNAYTDSSATPIASAPTVGESTAVHNAGLAYDSSVNSIQNFYLNGATIKTEASSTLVGMLAGYVNGSIASSGVSNSTIDVATSGATAYAGSSGTTPFTSKLSDYGSVGYCTPSFKATRNKELTTIEAGTTGTAYFSAIASGTTLGAGGSIEMDKIFNRLTSIRTSSTSTSISGAVESETSTYASNGTTLLSSSSSNYSGAFKQYYNASKGSFCFSRSDSSSFIYLYGGQTIDVNGTAVNKLFTTVTKTVLGKYLFSNGTNYLSLNNTTITSTTSSSAATRWALTNPTSGETGSIIATINSQAYYLYVNSSGSLALSTTAYPYWSQSDDTFSYTDSSSYYSYTYYLYWNGSSWTTDTYSSTTIVLGVEQATQTTISQKSSSFTPKDTYFPISADTSTFAPTDTNSGYIVSGGASTTTTGTFPYKIGDIRVSKYTVSGNLSASISSGKYVADDGTGGKSNLEILTVDHHQAGVSTDPYPFRRISDGYNSNHSSVSSNIANYTLKTVAELDLQKYTNSRKAINTLLSSSTSVCGLHFMDATINAANLVTAPSVTIKRSDTTTTSFTSYKMPRDSIDFNMPKQGYINFFAGSYFSGNNSFFSLHKIFRNAAMDITSIQEISKVYGVVTNGKTSVTKSYIYQFNGRSDYWTDDNTGSYITSLPTNYSLVFDLDWIKVLPNNHSILNNAMYYFEVPANPGEYALGSVTSGTGAYLIYLDLSANAQPVGRTIMTEYILKKQTTFSYPLGTAIVAIPTSENKESVDPLSSANVSLTAASFSGALTLNKTIDAATSRATTTITTDNIAFSPGYKADTMTLTAQTSSGGSLTLPAYAPESTANSYIKRMTYIDYNLSEFTTTRTVITSTMAAGNSTPTISVEQYAEGATTPTNPTQVLDNNGNLVDSSTFTDSSITVVDPLANPSAINLQYWYTYAQGATIGSITYSYTFSQTPTTDAQGNETNLAAITAYTITMASGGTTVVVYVDILNATYTVSLNGTTVAQGSTADVGGTGYSIP